jgi:hypothetical protein
MIGQTIPGYRMVEKLLAMMDWMPAISGSYAASYSR